MDLDTIDYVFNPLFLLVNTFSITISILTFYIVITKCDYKLPEMTIILILTVTHALSSFSNFIFSILKLIFGYKYLSGGSPQCIIFAITVTSTLRFELFTVGFLAFMRYAIVCHNIIKGTRFWLICYFIFISPLIAIYSYPIIMADGNPTPSYLYCSPFFKPNPNIFVLSLMHAFLYAIPCWISTYCYFVIGIKVYKKLKQIENEAIASSDCNQVTRIKNQKRNLIIQIVAVFIAFNLIFFPGYVTLALRYITGYIRPPIVDAIILYFLELSKTLDPIFTIIYQPELNHEFRAIITKSLAKFKKFIRNLFE